MSNGIKKMVSKYQYPFIKTRSVSVSSLTTLVPTLEIERMF